MMRKTLSALALALLAGTAHAADGITAHEWGLWHLVSTDAAETMPQVLGTLPPHVNNSTTTFDEFGWPDFGTMPDGTVVKKPVVWFYGPEGAKASYKLSPKDGGNVIANFPSVAEFTFEGAAVWNLTLGPKNFVEPEGEKGMSPWYGKLYLPDANSVSFPEKNETEGFLFYEASTFSSLPVSFTQGTLALAENIPLLVFITNNDVGLSVTFEKDIPATERLDIPVIKEQMDAATASAKLTEALVSLGLFEPEAKAFASVWQPELFETDGRRILAILPQETYARLLPVEITPAPESFVRVGAILAEFP